MKKASEYRRHAEECRKVARQMTDPQQRHQLLQMAETWDSLAAEREAQASRSIDDGSAAGQRLEWTSGSLAEEV